MFRLALYRLINTWLRGSLGYGSPTEVEEIDLVSRVNEWNKDDMDCVTESKEVDMVFDELVNIKVPGHLRTVTSHRKWIRGTLTFLETTGVFFNEKLTNLVRIHDLSKYSHKEVLGYAIMFGDGCIDFRQLEDADEKCEWENSLYNHYAHNPHHPEYFYPLQADGERRRDQSMMDLDRANGEDYLIESIIDMLASRGERYLAKDHVFSVQKWFDIPEKFFCRYCTTDQSYVQEKLKDWLEMCNDFLNVHQNAFNLKGIFDHRDVVF